MRPVNLEHRPTDLNHPREGDVVYGSDIGKSGKVAYVWTPCPSCGKLRWVVKYNGCPSKICRKCSGIKRSREGSSAWKGGRSMDGCGYTTLRLYPRDDFYEMGRASKGNGDARIVPEHRLVMARHLGRCLNSWEIVHHVNNNKLDNRIENLELVMPKDHCIYSQLEKVNKALRGRVAELEIEVQVSKIELEVVKQGLATTSRHMEKFSVGA